MKYIYSEHFKIFIIILVGCLVLGVLIFWLQHDRQTNEQIGKTDHSINIIVADSKPQLKTISEFEKQQAEQINIQQKQTQNLITENPLLSPIQGKVSSKPEYISQIEWDMLTAAAQNSSNTDKTLAQLVNSLRFNKMLEYWQTLNTSKISNIDQKLVEQLLIEIPEHFKQGELSKENAYQLQKELGNWWSPK